jgi:cyclic pyranopterin phosphate synthase
MPAEGIDHVPRKELLSYEDMLRLTRIMVSLGVTKVRLTGGEPFVRKNFYGFLKRLTRVEGLEKIGITTNGAVANRHIPFLKEIGITSINLSLDTLNRERFREITRRDFFDQAMSTYEATLAAGMKLNVNMVVMAGRNVTDIVPMARLTEHDNVTVRFIEEMPFNGVGVRTDQKPLNYKDILATITKELPLIETLPRALGTTAQEYQIKGFRGKFGIIAAWSRTFCGDCNRIRVTATGKMKNCLYDSGILNLKQLLSNGSSDQMISEAIAQAYKKKHKDGFESELNRASAISESMSTIGG